MSRKGENIHKRKDGRWEGRYKNGFNENGKPKYSSVYGKTYSETKAKLEDMKYKLFNNQCVGFCGKNFSNIAELWLSTNQIKFKGSTENKYHYMISKHINPSLGNYRIDSLNTTIINNFLYQKLTSGKLNGTGGLSPSYVRTMAILISAIMNYATDEGYCNRLKTTIYKPAIAKKKIDVLNIDTLKVFESFDYSLLTETRLGVSIALYAGLRIGEICALKWEDINFADKIIHVRHTVSRVRKNNSSASMLILDKPKTPSSERDIPIISTLYIQLEFMKNKSTSDYVISTDSNFVSPKTFDYRYKKLLNELKITPVNFHILRHTFATRCIETGMDIKSLSEILGHSNVTITLNTYVHSSIDIKRKHIEKLTQYENS